METVIVTPVVEALMFVRQQEVMPVIENPVIALLVIAPVILKLIA